MKYKTTAKAVRENSNKIIAIGYCGAQHLLQFETVRAYTSGIYGWNFDVYEIDGTTICTGYRNMPGKHVDYSVLKEYETKAEKIVYDYKMPYEKRREKVQALLREMIKSV